MRLYATQIQGSSVSWSPLCHGGLAARRLQAAGALYSCIQLYARARDSS